MPLKVAIIIERADITLGGAERSVCELSGALAAANLHVEILAARGNAGPGVRLLCPHWPGKRVPLAAFARALVQYLRNHHYDIVHSVLPLDFADVYQPRGGTYPEAVLRNAVSYRNSLIRTCKTFTAACNIRRFRLGRAERRLCTSPEGPVIAALSGYVAEQLKQHYNTNPGRIVIIRNGVRTDTPADAGRAAELRRRILAAFDVRKDIEPVLFLFTANNFRLKGLAPLLEAFSYLGAGCGSYLVVVGADNTWKFRRMARALEIDHRVTFLGPLANIQDALAATDVAVLPTFYDPASRFILEALAAAKPVITTAFNGAAELFTQNRHGIVIDTPENIPALAQAVIYFTDADNIRNASQAIIADNLAEEISIDRVAANLVELYESILQRKRRK